MMQDSNVCDLCLCLCVRVTVKSALYYKRALTVSVPTFMRNISFLNSFTFPSLSCRLFHSTQIPASSCLLWLPRFTFSNSRLFFSRSSSDLWTWSLSISSLSTRFSAWSSAMRQLVCWVLTLTPAASFWSLDGLWSSLVLRVSSAMTLGRLLMWSSASAASTSLSCLLFRSVSVVGCLLTGARTVGEVLLLRDATLERQFFLDPGKMDGA